MILAMKTFFSSIHPLSVRIALATLVGWFPPALIAADAGSVPVSLLRAVDLNVVKRRMELVNRTKVRVKLLRVDETRDSLRGAVRQARVTVEINGQSLVLTSATYHLPVTFAGVQIDCPITKGYVGNSSQGNAWGLSEGCAAPALAGGIALDRAGHICLSAQAALVCQQHANGQRASLCRWRRSAGREKGLLPLRTRFGGAGQPMWSRLPQGA